MGLQGLRGENVSATEMIVVLIPIKLVSVANMREHWAKKAGRTKQHRTRAWAELRAVKAGPTPGDVKVTITRIAPRMLDGDNMASACKATRDGIADWLGVPDNHPSITWAYEQRRGGLKEYAVEIAVEMGIT
jgi:hypothetical protein